MIQRDQTYDVLKGGLIFLVVLGHTIQFCFVEGGREQEFFWDNLLFRVIYSFHMPLFMLISGYFFSHSTQRKGERALWERFYSLGWPLITFTTIYQIPWFLKELFAMQSWHDIVGIFWIFLGGLQNVMWFLGAILFSCIVVVLIWRIKRIRFLRWGAISLLVVLLMITPDYHFVPATYKFMLPIFVLGYWIHERKWNLKDAMHSSWIWLLCGGLWWIGILFFDKESFVYTSGISIIKERIFDYHQLEINLYRWGMGMLGSFAIIGLTMRITLSDNVVTYFWAKLGRLSLGIYGFQTIIFQYINKLVKVFHIDIAYNTFLALFFAFLILFICWKITLFCERTAKFRQFFLGLR